jgi:hypothetical protein
MRLLTHVAVSLGVVGACGAGLHTLDPARFGGLGEVVQALNSLAEAQRRIEAIEARWQPILRRMRQREAVCTSLAAGRLSLLEAAVRFRQVQQEALRGHSEHCMPYPGNSEGERLCREVIAYTELAFAGEPDRCAALKARLDAELQALLNRSDAIALPDDGCFVSLAKELGR